MLIAQLQQQEFVFNCAGVYEIKELDLTVGRCRFRRGILKKLLEEHAKLLHQ